MPMKGSSRRLLPETNEALTKEQRREGRFGNRRGLSGLSWEDGENVGCVGNGDRCGTFRSLHLHSENKHGCLFVRQKLKIADNPISSNLKFLRFSEPSSASVQSVC